MKQFRGPKYQGGWIGLAIGAAGSIYSAYSKNKEDDQKQQNTEDNTNQQFQDSAWLAQQQRKFQLQDRQYKENAIRQYAPFAKGPAMPAPQLTATTGLADWQPDPTGQVPILNSSYSYAGQQPNG